MKETTRARLEGLQGALMTALSDECRAERSLQVSAKAKVVAEQRVRELVDTMLSVCREDAVQQAPVATANAPQSVSFGAAHVPPWLMNSRRP